MYSGQRGRREIVKNFNCFFVSKFGGSQIHGSGQHALTPEQPYAVGDSHGRVTPLQSHPCSTFQSSPCAIRDRLEQAPLAKFSTSSSKKRRTIRWPNFDPGEFHVDITERGRVTRAGASLRATSSDSDGDSLRRILRAFVSPSHS